MRETRTNRRLVAATTVKARIGMAALRKSSLILAWFRRIKRRPPTFKTSERAQNSAEKKRPVRGDNRTGQAIWALGVDGRSRRI